MIRTRVGFVSLIVTLHVGVISAAWQDNAPRSDLKSLRTEVAELCQIPDEPWRQIAWRTDLLQAQHEAVEQRKPLFIWAMDGHPLGCT